MGIYPINQKLITAAELYQEKSTARASERLLQLNDSGHVELPVEWAQQNRYMPPEISENYGQFDPELVPQLVEPLNCVHPDHPATHITLMKSVQSMGTVSFLENALGFWTKHKLGSAAYFTSSKSVGKIRSSSALDVLIDHGRLASLLSPISKRMARKTADTTMYKEFAGGVKWLISSYNSSGDRKSQTFNLMLLDELDEASVEDADQGDIVSILEGRTMATRMYKMLFVSTPSRMDTSRIWKSYCQGNQKQYFVPCPICGDPQVLELNMAGKKYGLTFGMTKDDSTGAKVLDLNSVRYICKHCHREFFESSKREICNSGKWVETWKDTPHRPKSPNHQSYHASGLISQVLPWARICQQFVNTDFGKNIPMYKDFTINYMGLPWARVEKNTSWQALKDRAEPYCFGEIPGDIAVLIYAGTDVQGDRLETAVVAVTRSMERYVIDYKIHFGNPAKMDDQCWDAHHEFIYTARYRTFGADLQILRCAIDTGYDPNQKAGRSKDFNVKAHTVFNYVAPRQDRMVAIKGAQSSKGAGLITERRISGSSLTKRYEIDVSVMKDILFSKIDETEGPYTLHVPMKQKEGFLEREIGDVWYKGVMSERYQEVSAGKMGWKKIYERNEPLDTIIYATACAYMDSVDSYDNEWWDSYENELIELANERE